MYGARFVAPTGIASRWICSSSRLEQALTSGSPEKAVVPRTTRCTRLGSCRPTESPLSEYDELPETLLLDGPTATARCPGRPGPMRETVIMPGSSRIVSFGSSGAGGPHVLGNLGGGVLAVRVGEPLHERRAVQGVLLRAHLLHDVDREQAPELGGALQRQPPLQGGEEAGAEGVTDTGRLDLGDLRHGGHPDRLLAPALDPDPLAPECHHPRADAVEDLARGPAGLLLDQRRLV